jgi:hypothetical protein
MLASITPLGERGRHSTWRVTVTAFALGALAGGAALGALAGGAGALLIPAGGDGDAELAVLAVAALIAVLLDARSDSAPGPHRQVNERWLDQVRGWVYGLGFGAQLGVGVTTVVSSAATYVALLAAFLSRDPVAGALIVGCFGAIRGLTPLVAAGVDRPERLLAFHAAFGRARVAAARCGLISLGVIIALAALGAAS